MRLLGSALVLKAIVVAGVTAQEAAAPRAAAAWTFLIYAAVDNNAEHDGNFFQFFDGVRAAFGDDPNMEIVLFIDRSDRYSTNASSLGEDFTDARLYQVKSRYCRRLAGGDHFPEITLDSSYEPDSANPENVRKFVAFGKARYPARHTALMLYGHANGKTMCPDEQTGGDMGLAQLTAVVTEKESVDLMALELCGMGGIEIAYQWRPGNGGFSTKILVAIPNAGPALEWKRVFWRMRSTGNPDPGRGDVVDPVTLTPEGFGKLIVREGGIGRRAAGQEREAVGCYDLTKAAAVKEAVDAWAVALAGAGAKETLEELRGPGPDGYALNYGRDRMDEVPYVDLQDLSRRAAACERLAPDVRQAASRVAEQVDALVVASWGGSSLPRFEAGASGVYIVFPDGDAEPRRGPKGKRFWDGCEWYSPLPVDRFYGRLAWCKDGATPGNGKVENWFELMDFWFDDTKAGPEGSNQYAH